MWVVIIILIFIAYVGFSAWKELKNAGGYENYKRMYHSDRLINKQDKQVLKQYIIEYDGRAETGRQYPFDIVGEASYQKNIAKFAEYRGDRDCFTEVEATINREPNNKFDKNACRVDIQGLTVGYFAKNNAESWIKLLNKLEIPENSLITVDAVIVGGGDSRQLGVRLDMPSRIANTAKYMIELERE